MMLSFRRLSWMLLGASQLCFANFVNGGFEDPYTIPSPNTIPYVNIPAWSSIGYIFNGYVAGLTLPPKSLADIKLDPSAKASLGITDIISNPSSQSQFDWFLNGATPITTIKLPENGTQTAMINLRSVNDKKSVSGTSAKPSGWATYGQQATALTQTITIDNNDIDPADGKVHIRFKYAPVLENPAHTAKQQPFYAIQINNLTTGRTGSNPLFFQWSYAAQAGVPWKALATKGINSGSNATYTYTDWQNFDYAPGNNLIHVGDQIQLIVLASGCSPGGHDGHIYLDDVTTRLTGISKGLLISVEVNFVEVPAGTELIYTYRYTNIGNTAADNVSVAAHMPQTQNTTSPLDTIYKTSTNPTVGTGGPSCGYSSLTNLLNCSMGTLEAGATGTFTMTVTVPSDWLPSYGPINNGNYPIQATGINPVLGNLVQTNIIAAAPTPQYSNLVVDVTGLKDPGGNNPTVTTGTPYTGTYTCSNTGNATAPDATCEISNLPPGLALTGCTYLPTRTQAFTQPAAIAVGQTVECTVAGTPTSDISREYDAFIQSNAGNNQNTVTNHATVPYNSFNNPVSIPATLNGSAVLNPAKVCCGRPVLMYDLSIESDLTATFQVISKTGNISCEIGSTGLNSFVKIVGRPGSCTVQGTKDGQISLPLVIQVP
jgi:hypothetical protein